MNEFRINKNNAKNILQEIANNGYKNVIISDIACYGGTAHHFMKVAKDFTDSSKLDYIKIRHTPEDRVAFTPNNGIFATGTAGKGGGPLLKREVIEFGTKPYQNHQQPSLLAQSFCCSKSTTNQLLRKPPQANIENIDNRI